MSKRVPVMRCTKTVRKALRAGWTFSQSMFPCDCETPDGKCDGRYGKCQWQK